MYNSHLTVGSNLTFGTKKCQANITINRNRLKNYSSSFYLKDKSNFEIELFNPHPYPVLAKINMNGKPISTSGIIVNPGQRIYLERYIDSQEKFEFSTYEIDGSPESQAAISLNGNIEVFFHYESFSGNVFYAGNPTWTTYGTTLAGSGTTTIGNNFYNASFTNSSSYSCSTSDSLLSEKSSKSIETGRVEKGERSNQDLIQGSGSFNTWSSENVLMKILPESTKPIEVSDIRNYCSNCGTRMKKQTWKFCPNCGSKI
jgi:Zn finger protein HypA/HybF involved in hydrogenase expression